MYESLRQHSGDSFLLHYLATDPQTYNFLREKTDDNVIPYNLTELPIQDRLLLEENHPMVDNIGQSPFHFALAPLFTNHLINKVGLPNALYVDSDILFYRDVQEIFDSANGFSIGLVTHKHQPLERNAPTGYYNVGIIYFRGEGDGKLCVDFWKDATIRKDHQWYRTHGTCGDQKYLELFPQMFRSVKLFDMDIGHGAPWNFSRSEIEDGRITWNSEFVLRQGMVTQPLHFNHFSHFTPNFVEDTYKVDKDGEWGNILPNKGVKWAYDDYFNRVKETKRGYNV